MKALRVCYVLLIVLLSWQCNHTTKDVVFVRDRPNIIFLLADDMRYDALGYTGNKVAITPSLDQLSREGTNFKNFYVTSSICAISRASILTGQYAKKHGITDFDKDLSTAALLETYPVLLRHSGYYTGFIGKYGVGNNLPSTFFNYWKGFPGHGVYFYKDSSGQMVHETEMMGRQAKEFLRKRDKSEPFCLSISFKAPHSEDGVTENNGFRWDPYFNNWYTNVQFPTPETYADSFYFKFPSPWRRNAQNVENEGRARWQTRFSTPEKFQTTYHAIYRLVSGVDKVVGELRQYLKENGLDQNTIIVFSSDNGYYMGEHGLEGKWYGHEESIRVPLIIYDPRMPQQRKVVEEIALNVDLAPTFLTWASIAVPIQMQGKPLQPLLSGMVDNWREDFFYEHPYPGSSTSYIPKSVGVVTPSWKYIRYYNGNISYKNVVYEELFDVSTDPHEKDNLAKDPAQKSRVDLYKKKVAHYEQQLKGW
jgi:arylsulfatase A-like enzyme